MGNECIQLKLQAEGLQLPKLLTAWLLQHVTGKTQKVYAFQHYSCVPVSKFLFKCLLVHDCTSEASTHMCRGLFHSAGDND